MKSRQSEPSIFERSLFGVKLKKQHNTTGFLLAEAKYLPDFLMLKLVAVVSSPRQCGGRGQHLVCPQYPAYPRGVFPREAAPWRPLIRAHLLNQSFHGPLLVVCGAGGGCRNRVL